MYRHILIATDGSEVGQKGVEHGISLARDLSARATVITVTEPYPIYAGYPGATGTMLIDYGTGQQETANAILAAAGQIANSAGLGVETVHVADSQPAEAIIESAKSRNCDLIVMGSHGRRGASRILIGSKTWEVVAQSHVPVLVVR